MEERSQEESETLAGAEGLEQDEDTEAGPAGSEVGAGGEGSRPLGDEDDAAEEAETPRRQARVTVLRSRRRQDVGDRLTTYSHVLLIVGSALVGLASILAAVAYFWPDTPPGKRERIPDEVGDEGWQGVVGR